ncbi:MAG: DNA (cytosine-5-)-methyltransferase [Acutalibacteraceae bacterium]|nr:DNA (cytosine-5-)-methyltransferase [Acutalibacteraceae bacterium]
MKDFNFIDLFSGIGGFHQAMVNLGGKCVLASEIDEYAISTYFENYNIDSAHDITLIDDKDVPKHDVLCGGFPCQSFSKAGKQLGFSDETKGTLFFQIVRILKASKPRFIILENVRNLASHDHGNTMKVIKGTLDELGYNIKVEIMSPHQLGVPQLRERVYILGVRKDVFSGEMSFNIPDKSKSDIDIYSAGIIDENASDKYNISEHEINVLNCWDEFHKGIKEKTLGFPIWMSEFGSTKDTSELPKWKSDFCKKNRQLYLNNKTFIDKWLKKWDNLRNFTPTERKFEWQAGESIESIWDAFIQFRPSGIRVKRPDAFPALVAMVQVPIIGKYKRRLTPREAARLQSFPDSFIPNSNDHQAYKQFGNAVNVNCVEYLAKQLFAYGEKEKKQ